MGISNSYDSKAISVISNLQEVVIIGKKRSVFLRLFCSVLDSHGIENKVFSSLMLSKQLFSHAKKKKKKRLYLLEFGPDLKSTKLSRKYKQGDESPGEMQAGIAFGSQLLCVCSDMQLCHTFFFNEFIKLLTQMTINVKKCPRKIWLHAVFCAHTVFIHIYRF